MLAIRIDLLTGRYAATAYNDREKVEWPPHPARLFSALVATWAEGQPGSSDGDAELAALLWLEGQPAPTILASAVEARGERTSAVVFVPVNDVGVIRAPDHDKRDAAERAVADTREPAARAKAMKDLEKLQAKLIEDTKKEIAVPGRFGKHEATAAEQALLDRRVRQPRTFPCAVPEHPAFAFAWADATPSPEVVAALSRLAQRIVRLGHSSSLVHARVMTDADPHQLAPEIIRFVPDERDGALMIRWVNTGQVQRLIKAHAQHEQVEPRVLPARFVRYREGEGAQRVTVRSGVFDDNLIIYARESGPRLPITSVAGLSRQFRRAMMSVAEEPIDEMISGHRGDSSPSEMPHLAIVPLPAVIGPHAEGAILGVALALPRECSPGARRAVMRALGRLEQRHTPKGEDPAIQLALDAEAPLALKRVVWGEHPRRTLQRQTWTRPARRWASATPIALDRNPGDLHHADPRVRAAAFEGARAGVIQAIQRLGLPAPIEVDVVRSCVLPGTAKPRSYPRFPSDPRKEQRVLVHVRIGFAEPVRGPLLLCAGRYQGLGLCLPVARGQSEAA